MKLSDIKPNKDNPRVIKDERFKKLVNSIKEFPKMMRLRPIVVDDDNMVLGGNMRLRALQQLGYTEIPDEWVAKADDLTEEEIKRFIIVDNVGFGENDMDMLANEWNLEDLDNWGMDIKDLKIGTEVEEDEVPEVDEESEPVSKLGEVYQLGRHRLMCGDSTKIEDVEKLMNGQKADMVLTDPPYGINYDDNMWEGIRGYEIESKRMGVIEGDSKPFDPSFLLEMFKAVKEVFIWGFQYYPEKLGKGGVVAWIKKTDAQKNMLYGDFELCWSKQLRNKMFLFPWGGFNNKERSEGERYHPTQKPVGILSLFIEQWGKDCNSIVDLFGGSGSTLIACEQLNRKCYMMELDPKYIDVIIKRWEQFTGNKAEKISE